jgi:hydroxyacylglutathione hydrolase
MQRQAGQITLPSSIAIEKATNPFLRTHNQALVARAAQQLNEPIATDKVAAFAQVRRAKDVF